MKDIHDANLAFFSPQPMFIAGFFFPQQIFQLVWLYKLWTLDASNSQQGKDLEQICRFVPYYALGNVCIGTWMFFWNSNQLAVADMFVAINTTAQLWYTFTQLEPMNTRSWPSILTHVVAKTFAGIAVLDILHNTSAAFSKNQAPSTAVKVLTAVGFVGLGSMSDWIVGGCLVYDLIALSVGQAQYGNKGWSQLLGAYAVGTAAVVGLKNYVK